MTCAANYWMLLCIIPLVPVVIMLRQYFLRTARQLKRLENNGTRRQKVYWLSNNVLFRWFTCSIGHQLTLLSGERYRFSQSAGVPAFIEHGRRSVDGSCLLGRGSLPALLRYLPGSSHGRQLSVPGIAQVPTVLFSSA